MSDSLSNLILSLTPEDGSTIGNGAMMALLREQVSTLTDDDYVAARDALVDEGLLGRGKGRGGSIFRMTGDEDDADVAVAQVGAVDHLLPLSESVASGDVEGVFCGLPSCEDLAVEPLVGGVGHEA